MDESVLHTAAFFFFMFTRRCALRFRPLATSVRGGWETGPNKVVPCRESRQRDVRRGAQQERWFLQGGAFRAEKTTRCCRVSSA